MSAIQKRLNDMETYFDQKEFVVVDIGTGFVKAGFSGEDLPRCVIPTVVGRQEIEIDPALKAGNEHTEAKYDYSFGNDAFSKRGRHELFYPVERGIITDFDRMETLWHHIFETELNLDPKNMNVLLTDSPVNGKENKQMIAEILFNKFQVESLTIMNTAVLSLFSTGKTSGLVVECGEGCSYSVPVFEGYALPHAINKIDLAGCDITEQLKSKLLQQGIAAHEIEFEYVREMKQQMCQVALDYDHSLNSRDPLSEEQRSYELPDSKQIIQIDHHKRFQASEILFSPHIGNYDCKGIAEISFDSIEKCDRDLKTNLYNNIVLSGGSTMLNGFQERFDLEIRQLSQKDAKTEINVFADLYRKHAAWIGGSMIASFSTFKDMTIKRDDYENNQDQRDSIVLKKIVY